MVLRFYLEDCIVLTTELRLYIQRQLPLLSHLSTLLTGQTKHQLHQNIFSLYFAQNNMSVKSIREDGKRVKTTYGHRKHEEKPKNYIEEAR